MTANATVEDAFFLPYQQKWIEDKSRFKLCEKGRQLGFSWTAAYSLVRRASLASSRSDFWISSRDDLQAKLFLDDCVFFAKFLNQAAQYYQVELFDEKEKKPYTSHDLKFANGTTIHSMSSNPNAQAGKRGTRVLDEFALHPDPKQLYSIAAPGITWGGSIELISTHRGSDNFFNKLIEEIRYKGNPKKFSLHTVTLQLSLEQGFLRKLKVKLPKGDPIHDMDEAAYFDSVRESCVDEETFLQEYMCIPANDASAFLESSLIDSALYNLSEKWDVPFDECQGDLYIGVDIGRHKDLTVIYVLEEYAGILFTRRMVELSQVKFSDQKAILFPMLEHPKVRRCAIDATGLGMNLAEDAKELFKNKVEEVTFSAKTKERLAYPLRGAFEDRKLRIPDDPKLRSDLRGIKKTTSAGGHVRFEGERTANGHSDRFWALSLAHDAVGRKGRSQSQSVKMKNSDNRRDNPL